MKTVKQTFLHYQKGTSNKVYTVYLLEISPSEYLVNFEYGRFGGSLKEGTKTKVPVNLEKAQKLYDSLVISKMNKAYQIKEGYDSRKKEEKKVREVISLEAYETLLLSRLERAKDEALHVVDNYPISKLIYKAGILKLETAKPLVLALYEQEKEQSNAFYYALAWTLGRYADISLRKPIESLRNKLNDASRYVVEEALFLLKEEQEKKQIEGLSFSLPFSTSLKQKNIANFLIQVQLLEEMIDRLYTRYKELDSWYEEERKVVKNELTPLLQRADELYLKLYIHASIDNFMHKTFVLSLVHLPLTKFNFSLFRRIYKMAEIRDDQEVVAQLITKIESKKMACYTDHDENWNTKPSLGCSKLYFKKRSLRDVGYKAKFQGKAYLDFAKYLLLSMNAYPSAFEAFSSSYYDENWNWKTKNYDAYSTHVSFMYILFGAGKRYMIEPSKKVWSIANKSIKDEHRPEMHKELWDKNPEVALEILTQSKVEVVQNFAFSILEEHPAVIENASLEALLAMLNANANKVRNFFFELLKERYAKTQEVAIVESALLSFDNTIASFALDILSEKRAILYAEDLMIKVVFKSSKYAFERLLPLLKTLEKPGDLVESLVEVFMQESSPLEVVLKSRFIEIFEALHKGLNTKHLIQMMEAQEISDQHVVAAILIRSDSLRDLVLPLFFKEKIANYQHSEMLATTIYLLGKLSEAELMKAHEMLVTFLYHEEASVRIESQKIIAQLAQENQNAKVFLYAIVEKSFVAYEDGLVTDIQKVVKHLHLAYLSVNADQLYRLLIAKSKMAVAVGSLILTKFEAEAFSVRQWARLAKSPNKSTRVWAYNAYTNHQDKVQEAMPKSLMIFDTHWEDTRAFASKYFSTFPMNTDDIVVVVDSNYVDVQLFAKKRIEAGEFDIGVLLTKLSQHPALNIQKFVTDLMLSEMADEQLLKLERFFNVLLHSVNQNRVAKTRIMLLLMRRLENKAIATMYAGLASHHSATMVWADKEVYVEAMHKIRESYPEIALPLSIEETEVREVL
ncbi:MAG: Probable DNA binding protein containing WGR domain [uncultured Sulfurovum sp.]|uniref:Probable DNA binding protein containing WGR domain n=1 Tax=uncultured Sulfurovum sp. TaxID=269237 RepID=A0A6S6TUU1_9BACT|nr:MAG: Probable DNA binding protein containing WGR domain [uncultured Sulfurovum sp.]